MPERNLILAVVLSAIVLFGWQYFVAGPQIERERARLAETQQAPVAAAPGLPVPVAPRVLPRAEALAQAPRIEIETPALQGSVNLVGARFDDLRLRRYHEQPDPSTPEIVLLSPGASERPYFAEFGWLAAPGTNVKAPDATTVWTQIEGGQLAPGSDVVLSYESDGLRFTRRIAVDENYLFTVTDRIENQGQASATLYPYALVSRKNMAPFTANWIVHEGFIGVADGVLQEYSYQTLGEDNQTQSFESTGGWIGITDKYWMASIVPPQQDRTSSTFKATDENGVKAYQSDYRLPARVIAAGGNAEVTQHLFAGAKVVNIIENYETRLGVTAFNMAVDWGWFWYFTIPIFYTMDIIYRFVGNFGVSILLLTVIIKLLFFPLASTSYRAMSRMKKMQPEMERLRETFKDDKVGQQQALMELYRKEKINPLAGCLPILIQIPVFFSLYKVLFVTIEMRHAPFFGWIRDLSAPEPISLFNLFGLIPWTPPAFLMIGVFGLIMGFTMWLQTSLNPPPADPAQARVLAFMPLIFTFMLAGFPAGLVIYWAWNNVLSIAQQMYIMKSTGTPIEVIDRLRKRLQRG